MKRNKKYNPNNPYNPAIQARQIDKLAEKLENHRRDIQAISKSHDNHISYLANFARHDIKNAIQSMDSIICTTEVNEFDKNVVHTLSTYLDIIRNTIDNFTKLVPYSVKGEFTLDNLMIAAELLARVEMQKKDIDIKFEYTRQSSIQLKLPFQIVLQMLNNLIINALKALENTPNKKLLILGFIDVENVNIKIKDNGELIEAENCKKIFEYGYSTTGGSGIGLYHATYLCKEFKGKITLDLEDDGIYNKTFSITLPIEF
jgi:signal transduction histidine kinase